MLYSSWSEELVSSHNSFKSKDWLEGSADKADVAYEEGDFAKAVALYRAYVRFFPDDQEVLIKYADTILKVSRSRTDLFAADQIYSEILKRSGGREEVRRSLINLKFETKSLVSSPGRENGADVHLKILLKTPGNENDSHLLYLMGQCDEARPNDPVAVKNAMQNYRKVVENKDAPDRIDAGARLAALLLHEKPKEPAEAQAVIDKLVEYAPADYRAYLARTLLAWPCRWQPVTKDFGVECKKGF